jgi:hypothetical protein
MSLEREPPTIVTDDATLGVSNVIQQTRLVSPRDLVRWGPILAGLIVAFTLFLLLSVLLVAIGAQAIRVGDPNVDEAAGAGAIVTAVIALLSFLIGGFVAGRTAAVEGRWAGLLNGFLVWGLGLLLVLLLAGMGLGGLLGASGELFQQYRAAGSPRPEADAADVLQAIRDSSFPAFLSIALPAAAAAIGGWLGGREDFDPTSFYRRNVA